MMNKMLNWACEPIENSDQLAHLCSLTRVFNVRSTKSQDYKKVVLNLIEHLFILLQNFKICWHFTIISITNTTSESDLARMSLLYSILVFISS